MACDWWFASLWAWHPVGFSVVEAWLWAVIGLFVLCPGCGLMVWFAFSLLVSSCGSYFSSLIVLVVPV